MPDDLPLQSEKLEPIRRAEAWLADFDAGRLTASDLYTRCLLKDLLSIIDSSGPVVDPQNARCNVSATGQHRIDAPYCKDCGQTFAPSPSSPIPAKQDRFQRHLDEASAVVATWEPWERNIFGGEDQRDAAPAATPSPSLYRVERLREQLAQAVKERDDALMHLQINSSDPTPANTEFEL